MERKPLGRIENRLIEARVEDFMGKIRSKYDLYFVLTSESKSYHQNATQL
jgi:hypothetical protein